MNAVADVLKALRADDLIPRDGVRAWMRDGDLETRGAVYWLTDVGWSRITPALGMDEQCRFMARYLLECISADPQSRDHMHGGFEAAWELAAWLKYLLGVEGADMVIREVAARLAEAYRASDDSSRNRIETGALEHILESKGLRPYFEFWAADPTLRIAYEPALEWGRAHENDHEGPA
jgi:hypothetical protein